MNIKAGALLLLTAGEYSDYSVHTLVRATEDLDFLALREEYLVAFPDQRKQYYANYNQFISWLVVTKRVVDEVPYREVYLGDYGSIEPELRGAGGGEG